MTKEKEGKKMRSMRRGRGWSSVVMVSCIAILVTSCTNLTAVREWSKTSLEATQYNELVTTYANTPERLKKYDPSGPWDAQIALRKNQAEALRQILAVVSDYMAALLILSEDSTVDYNKDMDALTISISKLDAGVSKETLGAVGSIAKAMLGAAAKAYQARQLTNIVEQGNDPLQTILRGELRLIVDQDFRTDLKIERAELDRYYDDLVERTTSSCAANATLQEWKELRLEQNAMRVKAVDAYIMVLDKVSEGHQKLYNNRNDLAAKALLKDLLSLAVELRKQIKILAKS